MHQDCQNLHSYAFNIRYPVHSITLPDHRLKCYLSETAEENSILGDAMQVLNVLVERVEVTFTNTASNMSQVSLPPPLPHSTQWASCCWRLLSPSRQAGGVGSPLWRAWGLSGPERCDSCCKRYSRWQRKLFSGSNTQAIITPTLPPARGFPFLWCSPSLRRLCGCVRVCLPGWLSL